MYVTKTLVKKDNIFPRLSPNFLMKKKTIEGKRSQSLLMNALDQDSSFGDCDKN